MIWGRCRCRPTSTPSLEDSERYQTVFSRYEGSVAAPTAGLHFTPELLFDLRAQGVQFAYVTLHVSLDTFRPVSEADPRQHGIHSEWLEFSSNTARMVNDTRLRGDQDHRCGDHQRAGTGDSSEDRSGTGALRSCSF